MKANLCRVAIFYAMGGLTCNLLGQKPSSVDLDRLSPSQLVKFVTYQNRSDSFDPTLNCVATGPAKKDQEAIERLVSLGERSVPALEEEFVAISRRGENAQYSKNAWRLFYAYARIRGARAFPRLREMDLSQHFSFAIVPLDGAIAVALGLTSYLSVAQPSLRILVNCQGPQPGDALSQMIVAWERGDRLWFETSLGETAAHGAGMKGDDWQALRGTLWHDVPNAAVGYKLPIQAHVSNEEKHFDLETAFYDRNGQNCGHMVINFVQSATPQPPAYLGYVVDNPNIVEVLQLISACARQ